MSLIPIQYRLLIYAAVLVTAAGFGLVKGMAIKGDEDAVKADEMQHTFDTRVAAANDALIAANNRASTAEATTQGKINAATTGYQGRLDEQAKQTKLAQERIAALSSGRERMRVDAVCRTNAGSGSAVPGAPATASGNDGGAASGAELSAAAAGRLATVAAGADHQIADLRSKLLEAQDYARAAFAQCGPQPDPTAEIAKKRSVLKLGAPNPFKD